MTVQDFIVNYSACFEFLDARHGKKAVQDYWNYLADTNVKLYEAVAEKGLEGYLEYFYGSEGTCVREHLEGGAWIDENGVYTEKCDCCPSVSALEARGKRPYRYYCEHCYWLYRKALEDHGYLYEAEYELQPRDGGYEKACLFHARPKAQAEEACR